MTFTTEQIEKTFKHQKTDNLAKGELWVGEKVFATSQLPDDLKGHIKLADRLGMDFLSLPLSAPNIVFQNMGYRRFGLDQIQEASENTDLFLTVIVDGPFQRLVDKHGLVSLIRKLNKERSEILTLFKEEASAVKDLIERCLDLKIGAVVIADDIAYGQATYMNPEDLNRMLGPFYTESVSGIHTAGVYALFHSCGNITGMLSHLISFGFDGFAACQSECIDLPQLKKTHGSQLTILAGIDADLIETEELTDLQEQDFSRKVIALAQGGGFILSSSCGLYSPSSLKRLPELYRIADQSLSRNTSHRFPV